MKTKSLRFLPALALCLCALLLCGSAAAEMGCYGVSLINLDDIRPYCEYNELFNESSGDRF